MLEERFYSLGRYFKKMFDERVHRINIQIPPGNAPGTYSLCAGGSLDIHHDDGGVSIKEQLANVKVRVRQRFKLGKFMASLHTAPASPISMDTIGAAVDELLRDNEIIGVSIAIRPDSITEEMRKFLKNTSKHVCTWLEPGLHTMHDSTLARMGLSHTYASAKESLIQLIGTKVHIAPHVVFGLPGETREMMAKTMWEISRLYCGGIYIHNFYVAKDTTMEREYADGQLKLLEREEYVGLVCDFIEVLSTDTVLHGIVDSVSEDRLVAPAWMSLRKENMDLIIAELEKRGSVQGCKLEPPRGSGIPQTMAEFEVGR